MLSGQTFRKDRIRVSILFSLNPEFMFFLADHVFTYKIVSFM